MASSNIGASFTRTGRKSALTRTCLRDPSSQIAPHHTARPGIEVRSSSPAMADSAFLAVGSDCKHEAHRYIHVPAGSEDIHVQPARHEPKRIDTASTLANFRIETASRRPPRGPVPVGRAGRVLLVCGGEGPGMAVRPSPFGTTHTVSRSEGVPQMVTFNVKRCWLLTDGLAASQPVTIVQYIAYASRLQLLYRQRRLEPTQRSDDGHQGWYRPRMR